MMSCRIQKVKKPESKAEPIMIKAHGNSALPKDCSGLGSAI